MMRIWGIEKANLTHEINKQDQAAQDAPTRAALAFRSLSDGSRTLDLLHRYETRYDRQYARAYRLLKLTTNLPPEPNPKTETVVTDPGEEASSLLKTQNVPLSLNLGQVDPRNSL